jgi:hypothetical protein
VTQRSSLNNYTIGSDSILPLLSMALCHVPLKFLLLRRQSIFLTPGCCVLHVTLHPKGGRK